MPSLPALKNDILTLLAAIGICILALLQAFGFCRYQEQYLLRHLPSGFLPEPPRVVLLTLDKSPKGYSALDVAMVLRGMCNMEKLHPRCILINGQIEPEQGEVPFLPDILARTRALPGLQLILPHPPSTLAHFESVSLIRYSQNAEASHWPKIDGTAIPANGDAFLPSSSASDLFLPLFALAAHEVPVGSLWWAALPQSLRQIPPLLLFNKILLFSSHIQIHLTPTGEVNPPSSGELLEMPLDDFLLQLEKKDQGTISPTFDTLWSNATVVLGTHDDALKVATFAALLQETAWRHLSLIIQAVITLGWIGFFIFLKKIRPIFRMILGLLLLILVLVLTLLLLPHTIIFPFLPGVSAALFLGLSCLLILNKA